MKETNKMNRTILSRLRLTALAAALMGAMPAAHAASITFNFGCNINTAPTPDTCTGASDYGFLTISDNAANPGNAVDLRWDLSPIDPNSVTLSRFLLNYEGASAPIGLTFPLGPANYNVNGWASGVGEYGKFDMRIGASSLIGSATLTATSGGLSALNFIALTPGGQPALYAAYQTGTGNSYHGASGYTVPEPETLSLLGLGLLGASLARRRAGIAAQ